MDYPGLTGLNGSAFTVHGQHTRIAQDPPPKFQMASFLSNQSQKKIVGKRYIEAGVYQIQARNHFILQGVSDTVLPWNRISFVKTISVNFSPFYCISISDGLVKSQK